MNKINYEKQREIQLKDEIKGRKLLLHSCCAPCSTLCLERVTDFFDVTVFYYNPNIDDDGEFKMRAKEQERFLKEAYGTKVGFVLPEHNKYEFYSVAKGLENEKEGGLRCRECFKLRLKKTAEFAKENGFEYFATTLTVSPLKNAPLLNLLGEEIASAYGVKWLYSDFKKDNGYIRSIELSRQYNLYRQDYCGCSFSKRDTDKRKKEGQCLK